MIWLYFCHVAAEKLTRLGGARAKPGSSAATRSKPSGHISSRALSAAAFAAAARPLGDRKQGHCARRGRTDASFSSRPERSIAWLNRCRRLAGLGEPQQKGARVLAPRINPPHAQKTLQSSLKSPNGQALNIDNRSRRLAAAAVLKHELLHLAVRRGRMRHGSRAPAAASGYANRRTLNQLTCPRGEPLTTSLAPIPVVDVREGGTLRHAQEHSERARALRDTAGRFLRVRFNTSSRVTKLS
jgi:hypothetical protein